MSYNFYYRPLIACFPRHRLGLGGLVRAAILPTITPRTPCLRTRRTRSGHYSGAVAQRSRYRRLLVMVGSGGQPPRLRPRSAAGAHPFRTFRASTRRLGLRELPLAAQDFGARTIEAHRVVPAVHDRQAVRNLAVAAAELDGD